MIVKSRAPLRLGLGGGGTDTLPYCELYGGYVLNATIGMYAYAILEDSPDGRLRFHATDRNERFEAAATPHLPVDGLLDLHKGVYNRIVRDFNGGRPLPVTLTTFSDALAGRGQGEGGITNYFHFPLTRPSTLSRVRSARHPRRVTGV